jgi:hypothetical protein
MAQDCSEIEGEDHQDKEGWEARVDDEAQDRTSSAQDRYSSRQVTGRTRLSGNVRLRSAP